MLLSPTDFGAPAKFKEWRQEQIDAILRVSDTDKRFVCLNMPTGSGKSLAGVMLGRILGLRTLILTAKKTLQDQISVRDGLVDADIRGQNNYECVAVAPYGPLSDYAPRHGSIVMVDRAPCHVGVHCWMKFNGCRYFDAVRRAREADIVSTNYSYWLSLGKAVRDGRMDEQLGKFDLIVADEAHSVVNEVCAALRVEIPLAELHGLLNVYPLNQNAPIEAWKGWADSALVRWGDEMDRLSASLRGQYIDPDVIDEFKIMQNLGTALEQVSDLSGDWLVSESWNGLHIKFDPVWPTQYTEELLFRDTKKVVLTSATIVPKTLDVIGISQVDREYVEYPSSFPVRNRPVYILTTAPRVDYKMGADDERRWIELIDMFIEPRLSLARKGIIHCVSYVRMERIRKLSKFRDYFITNSSSSETSEAVQTFKKSTLSILLSPSVAFGDDFPDDECRWILGSKLPFGDSRDPVTSEREKSDPGYGGFMMMITLAQSFGRGVRHDKDWCESIVIDGHATWAMNVFNRFAPQYFKESWMWVETIPPVLEGTGGGYE